MAAIEDRNGEEIQNAEVDADERHEFDDREGTLGYRLSCGAGNANNTLELLDGDATAEKLADDTNRLCDDRSRLECGGFDGFYRADTFVAESELALNTDLIVVFRAVGDAFLRRDGKGDVLAVAVDIELKSLATGIAHEIDELIPILNFLAIDSTNDIAIVEASAIRGGAYGNFTDGRRNGRVAKGAGVGIGAGRNVDFTGGAVIGNLEFEGTAWGGLQGNA